MLVFRKIDWIIQLLIMVGVLCYGVGADSFAAAGLFGLLGCWQVGSAAINTYAFLKSPLARKIILYWSFAIIDLLLVFSNISRFAAIAGMIGSGLTAIWYAIILKQLIGIHEYKKTINGIIKN